MTKILTFRSIQIKNITAHLKEDVGQSNGMPQSVLTMEHLAILPMYGVTGYFYGRCIQKENSLMRV